jgi:putative oxidoreductase
MHPSSASAGISLMRVALGTVFLAHSVILKLVIAGLPATASFFESVGLPGWMAYMTFVLEAVGGAALILGIQSRWVALALSPIPLGALIWVHAGNGWLFSHPGGGWEYPLYLFVLCIGQALLGDGSLALSPSWRPQSISFTGLRRIFS